MSNVRKNLHILRTLAGAKPPLAKAIIEKCNPDLIKVIAEIAHNCLKGNVKINHHHSRKLKPYRKQLHELANRTVSITRKRRSLQKGRGLITALIGGLLPAIIGAATAGAAK